MSSAEGPGENRNCLKHVPSILIPENYYELETPSNLPDNANINNLFVKTISQTSRRGSVVSGKHVGTWENWESRIRISYSATHLTL